MPFKGVLFFTSSALLLLGYWLYTPFPEEFEEPWIFRVQAFGDDILGLLSTAISKVTGWPFVYLFRNFGIALVPTVHHNYPQLQVEDVNFDGVPVRVYKHKTLTEPIPCVIFIHGGGWTYLSTNVFDSVTTNLAIGTGMIVVSVDYRLAPENPFPIPLEDCLKAARYVLKNGHKLGVDVNRVAVVGDSAGGNLATSVAQVLAKENPDKKSPLKLQVLIYPVTQVVNFNTPSYLLHKNNLIINKRAVCMFTAFYLNLPWERKIIDALEVNHHISANTRRSIYSKYFKQDYIPKYVRQSEDKVTLDESDEIVDLEIAEKIEHLALDPRVSPLLSEDQDLALLPPTYLVCAEFDVLRDEGLLYAERLRQAGVKVEVSYHKGQPHVFMAPLPPVVYFKGALKEWENIYGYLKNNL